jgi:hypothetical protein
MFIDRNELERKRRQQEQLAATLKEQIEERRRAKEQERKEYEQRMAAEEARLAQPAPSAPAQTTVETPAPTRAPEPAPKQKRLMPILKRQFTVSLPAPRPIAVFQVSTESPFAHSTVPTPPPGFSRRGAEKRVGGARMREVGPWEDRGGREEVERPTRLLNPAIARNRVEQTAVRLGTNSELIYPDGHMSPISSPRY